MDRLFRQERFEAKLKRPCEAELRSHYHETLTTCISIIKVLSLNKRKLIFFSSSIYHPVAKCCIVDEAIGKLKSVHVKSKNEKVSAVVCLQKTPTTQSREQSHKKISSLNTKKIYRSLPR